MQMSVFRFEVSAPRAKKEKMIICHSLQGFLNSLLASQTSRVVFFCRRSQDSKVRNQR